MHTHICETCGKEFTLYPFESFNGDCEECQREYAKSTGASLGDVTGEKQNNGFYGLPDDY